LIIWGRSERKTNKKIGKEKEREKTRRKQQGFELQNIKKQDHSREKNKGFLKVIRATTQGTLKLVRSFPNRIVAAVSK